MQLRTHAGCCAPGGTTDRDPFARLNADPRVMDYFPAPLSRAESDALAGRIQAHLDEQGWGMWAVEIPGATPFAGSIGLAWPRFEAHFTAVRTGESG